MSRETRLGAFATRAGQEGKALRALIAAADGKIGDLAALATTDKTSIVAALNEVVASVADIDVSGDVQTAVDALEAKLLGGATIDFDTLKEIADFANANLDLITSLTARVTAAEGAIGAVQTDVTALTGRVTTTEANVAALTTAVGDTEQDLVARFEAALV